MYGPCYEITYITARALIIRCDGRKSFNGGYHLSSIFQFKFGYILKLVHGTIR